MSLEFQYIGNGLVDHIVLWEIDQHLSCVFVLQRVLVAVFNKSNIRQRHTEVRHERMVVGRVIGSHSVTVIFKRFLRRHQFFIGIQGLNFLRINTSHRELQSRNRTHVESDKNTHQRVVIRQCQEVLGDADELVHQVRSVFDIRQ